METSITINDFVTFLTDVTQSKTEHKNVPQISFSFKNSSIVDLDVDLFDVKPTPSFIAEIVQENRMFIKSAISKTLSSYFSISKISFKKEDSFLKLLSSGDKKFRPLFLDFLNHHNNKNNLNNSSYLQTFLSSNTDLKMNLILSLYFESINNFNNQSSPSLVISQEYNSINNILDMCFQYDLKNFNIPLHFIEKLHCIKNSSHFYSLMNFAINNLTPEFEEIILTHLENSSYNNYQQFVISSIKNKISDNNSDRFDEIVTKNKITSTKFNNIELTNLLLNNPSPIVSINNKDISFTYQINLKKNHDLTQKLIFLEQDNRFKSSFRRKLPIFINHEEYSMFACFNFATNSDNSFYILIHDNQDFEIINLFKYFHNKQIDNEVINNLNPKLSSFLISIINNLFDLLVQKIDKVYSLRMNMRTSDDYDANCNLSISEDDYNENKKHIRKKHLLQTLDTSSQEKPLRNKSKI